MSILYMKHELSKVDRKGMNTLEFDYILCENNGESDDWTSMGRLKKYYWLATIGFRSHRSMLVEY